MDSIIPILLYRIQCLTTDVEAIKQNRSAAYRRIKDLEKSISNYRRVHDEQVDKITRLRNALHQYGHFDGDPYPDHNFDPPGAEGMTVHDDN